jgi:hypothetical protein
METTINGKKGVVAFIVQKDSSGKAICGTRYGNPVE